VKGVVSALACLSLLVACSDVAQVSPRDTKAYEASLTVLADTLVVAWHGGPDSQDAIYFRTADARGRPVNAAVQLTDGKRYAYEPDLASIGSDLLVAWYEKEEGGALTAYAARVDRLGKLRWQRRLSSVESNGRNPVIRVADGRIRAAWIETVSGNPPVIKAATLAAEDGQMADVHELGTASTDTWNLNAALDDRQRLYVVYDARLGTRAKELHLLRDDGDIVQHSVLSADDGFDSLYPDLALHGDRFALTWFDARDGNTDIYLRTGTQDTLGASGEQGTQRITSTAGASFGAYVAWSSDRIGLVWCDATPGQDEVYLATFDMNGRTVTIPRRLTDNTTQSSIPAIRAWHDGFALAWTERTPESAPDAEGHAGTQASYAVLRVVN